MSWTDKALAITRACGPAVKFAVKAVLGVMVPGSPAVIELVEEALDCVHETAKEVYEVRKDARPAATEEDLRRLEEVLGVLIGELSVLVRQAAALDGMPDAARQILNTAIAADERVQASVRRLGDLAQRFDRLEQQNRVILQRQGYAAGILEEMLPVIRRMAVVADWVEEFRAAGLNGGAFRECLEAVQRLEERFAAVKLDEALAEARGLVQRRPDSAASHVAAAAVEVARQDLPAAEAGLDRASRLRPQDRDLASLRDRVTRATRGGAPFVAAGAAGLRVGDQLDGWRLESLLGHGGWGQVFRASRGGQAAALKAMRPELAREPGFEARFRREIETLSGLRGTKHVIDILGSGYDGGRGCWYFLMEYIDGASLERYLQVRGPLTAGQARRLFLAVAEGLAVAHSRGVVHRDIKPSNIMLRRDGSPVLVDFGVATSAAAGAATQASSHTAQFASPEQLRGRQAGPRSDVYSLAASMWYALAYDRPDLREPEAFKAEQCPEPVREVLARALQAWPEDRHTDAAAFRDHLLAATAAAARAHAAREIDLTVGGSWWERRRRARRWTKVAQTPSRVVIEDGAKYFFDADKGG